MTRRPVEVLQVLGRARPGDPATAAARGLRARLARLGWSGRLVAADPGPGATSVVGFDRAMSGHLVVHSRDGGEDLGAIAGDLVGRDLTLVHHGSAVGSNRATLRALRSSTARAVAVDPAAREELRGLGFATVGTLDPRSTDDAFDGVTTDPTTSETVARHPGSRLLYVGQVTTGRGLERLLDAFIALLGDAQPAAVLSICGPASPWYRAHLQRYVAGQGLLACDLDEPANEGQVLARIELAHVVISPRPASVDPYLRAAVHRGIPVVAPAGARTAHLGAEALISVAPDAGATELARALDRALSRGRASWAGAGDDLLGSDADLVRALGLT